MRAPERAALTALVVACAGSASAQVRGEPQQFGRFSLGPIRVAPRIELRNAGVDTNVFNSAATPVADTAVVLRTSLDGYLPVRGRIRLWGTGYTDFNYFRRESTERSTDFGGSGHAEMPVGPFVLFGGGGGGQARQRASIDLDERVVRQERSALRGRRAARGLAGHAARPGCEPRGALRPHVREHRRSLPPVARARPEHAHRDTARCA